MEERTCPLCQKEDNVTVAQKKETYQILQYNCPRCGEFDIWWSINLKEYSNRLHLLSGYCRHLKEKGESSLRRKIKKARDQFDKNSISTIHSFCANLLREHPVESEIDSGFNIIQGIRKNELLDGCIKKAILNLWKEG